jgi:hypothetical protein
VRFGATALVLATASAHAAGRPPLTTAVRFDAGDPRSLYVATTFGLLVSHDDGCSFRWICEANIGYGGVFDPKYAIARDGSIFATTFTGLEVSRDGGCSFAMATAERPVNDPDRIADTWIDAIDLGPDGAVWVGTAESGKPNDVYVSLDNGSTFASVGLSSPTIWWKSVRVAPSDARRVYVTGYEVAAPVAGGTRPRAHLLASDDGGARWTASPLAGVALGATPIVLALAVDPRDRDVVYVASWGAAGTRGDVLYRSRDGGATLERVLVAAGTIRDVAIVDERTVIVATTVASGPSLVGGPAYRSTDGGATFGPLPGAPQLACVARRADGVLFGCASNWAPDNMAIARSDDRGATWQRVARLSELAGPLSCEDGTGEQIRCARPWPALQRQLGANGPSPTCLAPAPTRTSSGGCCDAGGAPGGALVILVAFALRRRRA